MINVRFSPEKPYTPFLYDDETGDFLPIPWVFGLLPGQRKPKPRKGAWIRDVIFGGEVFQFKFFKRKPKKEDAPSAEAGTDAGEAQPNSGEEKKPDPGSWMIVMMGRYSKSIADPRERRIAVFESVDLESWGVELYRPLQVEKGELQVPKWAYPTAGRIVVAQLAYSEKVEGSEDERRLALAPCMIGSSDGVNFDLFKPMFEPDTFGDSDMLARSMEGKTADIELGGKQFKVTRFYDGGEDRTFHVTIQGELHTSLYPMKFERDNRPKDLVDCFSKDGMLWTPVLKFGGALQSEGAQIVAGDSHEEAQVDEMTVDHEASTPDEVLVPVEG